MGSEQEVVTVEKGIHMELRFHGPFPPKVESGIPGTIAKKSTPQQQEKQQQGDEYEPVCLLQAWSEPREGGKLAYLFLMYDLQLPPWEVAHQLTRYFKINPIHDKHHLFIGCTPPNNELLKPIYTKFNFEWEWRSAKWVCRGGSWVWQSSGPAVALPYSETPITAEEETQYAQQLEQLMCEAEKEQKPALPPVSQRFLLPVFSRSQEDTRQVAAIAEKSQANGNSPKPPAVS
jgi:hypothetical protein